jgi:hypothetical protein
MAGQCAESQIALTPPPVRRRKLRRLRLLIIDEAVREMDENVGWERAAVKGKGRM